MSSMPLSSPSSPRESEHVFRRIGRRCASVATAAWVAVAAVALAQTPPVPADALHRSFDQILDTYVRDGLVYYRALKAERASLDAYIQALDRPEVASQIAHWPRDQQAAFWVNAYNAFVLQTVIDHYPIRGGSPQYPADSIRQIPGAFDRLPHRAAGRLVVLDEIEQKVLAPFKDPRVYLVLGRGAVGSGRLHSEAFSASRLETQLKAVTDEFATNRQYFEIRRDENQVVVTPILGWRQAEFIAAYGGDSTYASRSPIERAILTFVEPGLFPSELEYLERNAFKVTFRAFDWKLNDLTGGAR